MATRSVVRAASDDYERSATAGPATASTPRREHQHGDRQRGAHCSGRTTAAMAKSAAVRDSTDMRPRGLIAPRGVQGPHREIAADGIQGETESIATVQTVLGGWLEALAVRVKLHRTEWQVIAIVLSSPCPVSASSVAKRLRLDYGLVKRVRRSAS